MKKILLSFMLALSACSGTTNGMFRMGARVIQNQVQGCFLKTNYVPKTKLSFFNGFTSKNNSKNFAVNNWNVGGLSGLLAATVMVAHTNELFNNKIICPLLHMDSGSVERQMEILIEARVNMPTKGELQEKINEAGYSYLLEKSHLLDDLADRKLNVFGIVTAIEFAFRNELERLEECRADQREMATVTMMWALAKPELLRIFLQYNPQHNSSEIVNALREKGFNEYR